MSKLLDAAGLPLRQCVPQGAINGWVQLFTADPDPVPASKRRHNLLMYEWAAVACRRLFSDDYPTYRVNAMYFEYENVADPGDPVSVSEVTDRTEGISYFVGLADPRDYIRAPLVATSLASSDVENFPNKNSTFIYAQTPLVTEGVNGLDFGNAHNSKIYGLALVAMRDEGDPSQDIVIARHVFTDGGDQQLKPASGQVGATWEIRFE